MLEKRKNVRKIIAIVIALIVILGVFINLRNWRTGKIEIDTMPAKEFGKAKDSLRIAAIDLDERSNSSNLQATMAKSIKHIR